MIAKWPVRELLLAYMDLVTAQARHAREQSLTVWASLAPFAKTKLPPPKKPSILEDTKDDEHT